MATTSAKEGTTRVVEMEEAMETSSQGTTTKEETWLGLAASAQPPPWEDQVAWVLHLTWEVTKATTAWAADLYPLLEAPWEEESHHLGTWEVEPSTIRVLLSSNTTTSNLSQPSNSSDNRDNTKGTSSNTPRTTATSPSSNTRVVPVVSQPVGTLVTRVVLVVTTNNNQDIIRWEDKVTRHRVVVQVVITSREAPQLEDTTRAKEGRVTNPLKEGSLETRVEDSRVVINRVDTTKVLTRVDEVVTKVDAVLTRDLVEEATSEETAGEEDEVEEATQTSVKFEVWRTRLNYNTRTFIVL